MRSPRSNGRQCMKNLSQTKRQFKAWRAAHKKGTPFPPQLRQAAVELAGRHASGEVVKALGISSTLLSQWRHGRPSRRLPSGGRSSRKVEKRRDFSPRFIDITPLASSLPAAGTTLTIEIPGRGTIRLFGSLGDAAVRAAITAALASDSSHPRVEATSL